MPENTHGTASYTATPNISCIILAGGEGKRVDGQDKGLLPFRGEPLIRHVIRCVRPQVDEIIISANRNLTEYGASGYPVITDEIEHCRGPLAGLSAALPSCQYDWVLVVPCDMPLLPDNLVNRLSTGINENTVAIVEAGQHLQLAFLLNKSQLGSLRDALSNNQLKLMQWIRQRKPTVIKFDNADNFKNLNTPSDFNSDE